MKVVRMNNSFKLPKKTCICLFLFNFGLQFAVVHSSTYFKFQDHKSLIQKRAINDFCIIPPSTPDKTISYSCNENNLKPCGTYGVVPELTVAKLRCNPNYVALKKTQLQSICKEKIWVPPIDKCYKKCDKLNPINVDLECYRDNLRISCDDILYAGSRVRATCKFLYTQGYSNATYQEIFCQDDGKWDKTLLSCIPVCGRPYANITTLISKGVENKFGDSPWHVAIYNEKKVLICGGTIISSYMILSAAHCFHDRNDRREDITNYEIVVSKASRNYSLMDNQNQKTYKIKEIRFSKKGYIGLNNYFAADIAIIILHQALTISPTVLPACIHWKRTNSYPQDGTYAKVSGWGLNEHGRYSEKLVTAELPFISRERCLNSVPHDFQAFITFDKFCAGSENGPGVLQGDSGGGLLFYEENSYYVRGIVSLKQASSTSIATFTDITDHVEWILSVRKETEPGIILVDNRKIPPRNIGKCEKLNPRNVDLQCYYQGTSVNCNGPLDIGTKVRPTCKTLHTYEFSPPLYREISCNENGKWDNVLFSCVPDCGRPFTKAKTLIAYGEDERYGDSPWNVAVYRYNVKRNYELICGGTIISSNLIVSAAHCFYDKDTKTITDPSNYEIVVSKVTRHYYTKDNENQKSYKIKEIRVTPKFLGLINNFDEDIAVLILSEKITMSPTVMPACVDWTTKIAPPTEGSPGKTVGWGMDENGDFTENLQMAYLSFISYGQCLNKVSVVFKPFITSDKFCAGSEQGPGILRGDSGGGLLFQENYRYFIRGIQSIKEATPLPPYIASFTDINEYIHWIIGIRNEVERL